MSATLPFQPIHTGRPQVLADLRAHIGLDKAMIALLMHLVFRRDRTPQFKGHRHDWNPDA